VKGRVRQPGLVKVQVFYIPIEHGFDGLRVVEHAVVGRLGERHHPGFDLRNVDAGQVRFDQGVGGQLGLDGRRLKLVLGDGADDAKVVARGLQKTPESRRS
jgi:hypothetical protein